MKTFKITYILAAAIALTGLSACNKFLDTTPDNRATVDSEEKVISLLGSAYSENDHILIAEFYSDNVDNYGIQYTGTSRFFDSIYEWSELEESNNESTRESGDPTIPPSLRPIRPSSRLMNSAVRKPPPP